MVVKYLLCTSYSIKTITTIHTSMLTIYFISTIIIKYSLHTYLVCMILHSQTISPRYIANYSYIQLYKCNQICQKGSYTCTVSKHTFHHHLIATSMDQQHMYLILLKFKQSAFTQASFSSLMSTIAQVVFTWPHLPLISKQQDVIHHTHTG